MKIFSIAIRIVLYLTVAFALGYVIFTFAGV